MEKVELMSIQDTFYIKSIGLVLVPSFELPKNGNWVNIREEVTIKTPNGKEMNVEAQFSLSHLNIKDPEVNVSKRWPVILSLLGVEKQDIPLGSTVYVNTSTKSALLASNA